MAASAAAAFLGAAIFAAGIFILGAQACIEALAAALYPTSIRSTGLGWAFGIAASALSSGHLSVG